MSAAAAGGLGAFFYQPYVQKLRYHNVYEWCFRWACRNHSWCWSNGSISTIIGAIGGAVVVLGVALLDKCKLDDPVGAIPVHLFAGIWGTLAVGLLSLSWFRPIYGSISKYWNCWCILCNWCFYYCINSKINYGTYIWWRRKRVDISEHGTKAFSS